MTIPYTKNTTWADGSGGGTAITATKLNNIEDGIFTAQQMPAVRVTHNAAQSITSGVPTALAFNTERFDTASGSAAAHHDTVTNNSRLTCLYAGKYQITGNTEWAANATGGRDVGVRLNGTTTIGIATDPTPSGASVLRQSITTLYDLAVNDYVELVVTQSSGGALNVNQAGNYTPEFMMVRVA